MSSVVIARPAATINIRALVIGTTIAVAVVYLLTYITAYSDNAPWWDEWGVSLPVVINTLDGSLSLEQLFTQHNAHRIVPTNLLTALNAILFRWELRFEIVVNVLLALVSLLIIGSMARWSALVICGAALLMFSLRLDWLWAFNSQSHFALFFILATLWLLRQQERVYVWAALLTGIAATYSFGYGVIVWPLGWSLLFLTRSRRSHLLIWSIASFCSIALFALTYNNPQPSVISATGTAVFIPRYLGAAFFPSYRQFMTPAFLVGVVGLGLMLLNTVSLWRGQSLDRTWLVIAALPLAVGVLISFGRGPDSALNGRYGIMGNVFWAAYLAFLVNLFSLRGHRILKQTNILFVGLLVGVFFYCQQAYWLADRVDRESCIVDLSRGCLELVYPHPDEILDNIEQMRELRLGLFR